MIDPKSKVFEATIKVRARASGAIEMGQKIRLMILSCAVGMRDYDIDVGGITTVDDDDYRD